MARNGAGRPRVRMDYEERRQQILDAAMRLFRQRPYSQVSVSDIATEAGVAKGLLHHYFDSKRELYLEVVRTVAGMVAVPVDGDGSADATDTWERTVDGFLSIVGDRPDLWLSAVTVGGAENDDEVASILDDSREVVADQTLEALGLGDRADEPALRALVRAYGGFVQELTVEWLGRKRVGEQQVRAAMVAALPLLLEQVLPLLEDGD